MTLRKRRNQPTRSLWTWGLDSAAVLLILAVAFSVYLSAGTDNPIDLVIGFQQYHYGAVPEEFDYDATSPNGPVLTAGQPFWRVYLDRNAPSLELVLIQAASLAKPDHYPIALLRDVQAKDVTVAVYLKPMGGTMDQSQGIIWRV